MFQVAVIRKFDKRILSISSRNTSHDVRTHGFSPFPILSVIVLLFTSLNFQRVAVIETVFEQLLPGYLTFIARLPAPAETSAAENEIFQIRPLSVSFRTEYFIGQLVLTS